MRLNTVQDFAGARIEEASDLLTPDWRPLVTRADVIAKAKAITTAVLTIEGNAGEDGG